MDQPRLNFGIVGCGRIAQRHAQHITTAGRLAATCDVLRPRAQQLAKPYSANAYQCLHEMLRSEPQLDVVSVCSPNGLHATHAIQALRAGKHVICEKPMALTATDCGDMIQAAELANRRLFVVKQNRFNPPVAAVKEALELGKLGQIYSVQLNCFWNRNPDYYQESWKGTLGMDGGCLFTQFSHFVDLLYWMVGDIDQVHAFADNFAHKQTVDFEDCGVVALRFRNGVLGTIHFTVNSHRRNMEGSLTLFGQRGTVKIGGQYLNELEYQDIEDYEIPALPPGNTPNRYGHYEGSMSNHDRVYANVVDVLTRDGVIATNAFEGLKTVEMIEAIYSKIRWNPAPSPLQPETYNSATA